MKPKLHTTASMIVATLAMFASASTEAAVIIDGNFELPVVSAFAPQMFTAGQTFGGAWRVDSAEQSVVLTQSTGSNFQATPDGNQFVFNQSSLSAFTLSQDISDALPAGSIFTIQFLQSTIATQAIPGRLNLRIVPTGGGTAIYNNDFLLPALTSWTQQSATFSVPTTGNYTVSFSGFTNTSAAIDRVAIVPEPSTIGLLLFGVAFLSTRKRA